MYKKFYKLNKDPFSFTANSSFTVKTKSFDRGVDNVFYGIEKMGGIVVVTGDIGTGKTTLCNYVLDKLKKEKANQYSVLMIDPFFLDDRIENIFDLIDSSELINANHTDLKQLSRHDFCKLITYLSKKGKKFILMIDEADKLSDDMLQNISFLSNMEDKDKKLMQIVLVGEPTLSERLRSKGLKQLNQRVSVRYKLQKLTFKELSYYISHRLFIAGDRGSIKFNSQAIKIIYKYTDGCQRLVNIICDRALLRGSIESTLTIDKDIVMFAMRSLRSEEEIPSFRFVYNLIPVYALEVAFIVFLAFGIWSFNNKGVVNQELVVSASPPTNEMIKRDMPEEAQEKESVLNVSKEVKSSLPTQTVRLAEKKPAIDSEPTILLTDLKQEPLDNNFEQDVKIAVPWARIRKDPDVMSEILDVVRKGTVLKTVKVYGKWVKVLLIEKDKNNPVQEYGWVGRSLIQGDSF